AEAIVSGETSWAPSTNDGFEGSSGSPVSAPVIPAAVVISVIEHRSVSYAAAMVAVLIDQYKPLSIRIGLYISLIAFFGRQPSLPILAWPPSRQYAGNL